MDSYFLVFQSLGPVELLILFGLASVAWPVWSLTRGFRSRQLQITARPNPDEPLQAHITWYVHGGMRYNSVGGWAVVNGAMTWPSGQHTCGTQPLLCASMSSRFGG